MKLWATLLLMIGITFTSYSQNLQIRTIKQSKVTPYKSGKCSVGFNLDWPVAGTSEEAIRNIQHQLLQNIFGDDATYLDIYGSINNYIISTVYKFKKDFEDDFGGEWQETFEGHFLPAAQNYISYVLEAYLYAGGAHGVANTFSTNFNLKTGRRVLESDLFIADHERTLLGIIKSNLSKSHPDIIGDITWESVEINHNFFITNKGITYIFNPYEIAYYALGTIEVTLPWKDLVPILKRTY
jgi:hypothetical protein